MRSVIISAVRTPTGKFLGALKDLTAPDLGAFVVREAVKRAGVDPDLVVKPFGWKGTQADFADFATDALQIHFGIQNDVLLATGSPAVSVS